MRVPPVPQISTVPDAQKLLRDWERYLKQLQELIDGYEARLDAQQTQLDAQQVQLDAQEVQLDAQEVDITDLQNDLAALDVSNSAMLAVDNSAIPAGTVPVVVAGLVQPVKVGEAWYAEWVLDLVGSAGLDVFKFNVQSSAGTFTGRFTVLAVNAVPGTWDGGVDLIEGVAGVATAASDFAPGEKAAGDVTTVRVCARGVQSVADGDLQVCVVATTGAGVASGTVTVKARSHMFSRKAA